MKAEVDTVRHRGRPSIFTCLAFGLGAMSVAVAVAEVKRPNVIVFLSDQQRWDTVGCYGQKLPLTPRLDRMAAEGVRFQYAFTSQPVCGPTRAVLQTGKYATQTGCFRNGIPLPSGEKTLAHWFSEAGYDVGYIGKWHLASTDAKPVPPERRGGYKDFWLASDVLEFTSHSYDGHMFDGQGRQRDFPPGQYRVDVQTDWVLEYLRTRTGPRPFFLFVSYIEPHHQNDHNRFEGPKGSREEFRDYEVPGDLAGTKGDWRQNFPDYLGCIHSLDQNLGRVRDELTKLGLAENTLLVCSSDHGCHFRTRNGEYKRSCHDGCTRIPLVACGPGFRGGKVVKDLVSLIDVPPTLLAAGGIPTPTSMQGRPLQGLVDGTAKNWPEEVFIQISESQVGRAIRTKRWKYSVRAPDRQGSRDSSSDVYEEDFLYNLEKDPHERNNLVADPSLAGIRSQLAERLKHHMVKAGEPLPRILPAKKPADDAAVEEKYQTLVARLPPDEQAWERTLQANLGSFYLPIHKRERIRGIPNAWAFVKDEPKLPRVLLIGDSVSRGYTMAVRKALSGKANVHRAPENCGGTANGLKKLDVWLGDGKWDLIHFNFGIHDRATPLAQYEERLERIVARLQKTGAKLIWASTTPIPRDEAKKQTPESIVERNAIAERVMQRHGIPVDDLCAFITPHLTTAQNPNDVHFNAKGYEMLGGQVAQSILGTLKKARP